MNRDADARGRIRLLGAGIALVLLGAIFYVWDVGYTQEVAKSCAAGPWPCTAVNWSPLGLIVLGIGLVLMAFVAVLVMHGRRSMRRKRTTSN
jgi:hypothetical protein